MGPTKSGKSSLLKNLFGIQTVTGSSVLARTMVPTIYSPASTPKLGVVDYPGMDDAQDSLREIVNQTLDFAGVAVIVVHYENAHTEPVKAFLKMIIAKEAPFLVCFNKADKLYKELIKKNSDISLVQQALKKELEFKLKAFDGLVPPEQAMFTVIETDKFKKISVGSLKMSGISTVVDVGLWIHQAIVKHRVGSEASANAFRAHLDQISEKIKTMKQSQ